MTRYTNFILTVIAVSLIGILFKGSIISSAKAASRYSHWKDLVGRVGYAPTTPAMSMQYSTIELTAHKIISYLI